MCSPLLFFTKTEESYNVERHRNCPGRQNAAYHRNRRQSGPAGRGRHPPKLVLVTAINPTPAGEGKTTTTVGLADALRGWAERAVCLREPSLGPVFGVKGRSRRRRLRPGGPMEDINLHFTGDFHAIGAANNLLAAMLDNHPAGQPARTSTPAHHLEALHGHERPPAAEHRGRPGRQGQRHPARGRL